MMEGTALDEGAQSESWLAESLMVTVGLLVIAAAVGLGGFGGVAAGWTAGVGAALFVIGGLAGHRGAVSGGVILLAIASLVATHDSSITSTLAVNAAMALVCVAALVGADLSFSGRRHAIMANQTTIGFAQSHAASAVAGVGTAVLALAIVLNIDWPSWLVLLPAVLLAAGALTVTIVAFRYRRSLREPVA